MKRTVVVLGFLVACADHGSSTSTPKLTGDTCSLYTTAPGCQTDTSCTWLGTGCACPPNNPSCGCSAGACVAINNNSGSGSGSSSTGAACACPNGEVCFEQVGGPAQPADTGPQIECAVTVAGSNPCAGIQNEGTCSASTAVSGLCICDNGLR